MLTLSLILHGPGKNSLQSSPVRCELCIELICVREPHHYIGSWTRPLNAAHHRWHYILFNSVQMNLLGESMPAANLSYYAIFLFFISQSGVKINNDHIHKRHNHLLEFLVCMPILGYIYTFYILAMCFWFKWILFTVGFVTFITVKVTGHIATIKWTVRFSQFFLKCHILQKTSDINNENSIGFNLKWL